MLAKRKSVSAGEKNDAFSPKLFLFGIMHAMVPKAKAVLVLNQVIASRIIVTNNGNQ